MKNAECSTKFSSADVVSGTVRGNEDLFGRERDFQHLLNRNRQMSEFSDSDHAGSRVSCWLCGV